MAWRRGVLRSDDDVSPWFANPRWRPALFGLGVITALLALESPIDTGGDRYLFLIHMLQHLLLMMVAPPLIILGIAGATPRPRSRYATARRLWRVITRPWIALVIFNAVMVVWHIPELYDTTLTVQPVHIVEHLSFIAVGLIFWWGIVDPIRDAQTVTVSPLVKIAALVVSGIPPTVLGILFALAPTAFYSFYVHAPRLWGLSPLTDQQIGGVLMLGLGNIVYFVAITLIFMRLLGDTAHDEEEAARLAALRRRPAARIP
jgi:cytochrome c oxidase assembly factor CtaG